MKITTIIIAVVILIIAFVCIAKADDIKIIQLPMQETSDCKYPSTSICIPDEHAQCHSIVQQDPSCQDDKPIASYVRSEA